MNVAQIAARIRQAMQPKRYALPFEAEQYARKAKFAPNQQEFAWITIGAQDREGGGTHVQIKSSTGEIVAGPDALTGKKVGELGKKPEPKAEKPARKSGYFKGDQIEYTGKMVDGFHEFEYMEGHKKGETGVTATAPDGSHPRDGKFQEEWKQQQEEFGRLRDKTTENWKAESESQRDTAVVNVPIDKRGGGDLNSQIDRWKKEQAATAKKERSENAQKKRDDKAGARELFDSPVGQQLIKSTAERTGKTEREVRDTLDSMVKWQSSDARKLLENEHKKQQEQENANKPKPEPMELDVPDSMATMTVRDPNGGSMVTKAKEEHARLTEATPETEPPKAAKTGLDLYADHESRIRSGAATSDELRQWFKEATTPEAVAALKAELSKKKIDELKKMGAGGWHAAGMKKDELIDDLIGKIHGQYHVGQSLSYNPFGGESHSQALAKAIDKQTDDDVKAHADRIAKDRKEREERRDQIFNAIKNPQTLEDFKLRQQFAKDKALTPEMQERYDELTATTRRAKEAEQAAKVQGVTGVSGLTAEIKEGFHAKKQKATYVAVINQRVERDKYNELLGAAKKLGGYYSSFKGAGAIPGFQFDTKEAADKFRDIVHGNTVDRSDILEQRSEAKAESRAETLRERAESITEDAESTINADRKTNTHRRAEQAARIESRERQRIAHAGTMKKIADGLESGTIKHLSGVRAATHVEELDTALKRAQWNSVRNAEKQGKSMSYDERENERLREPTSEDITHAEYPYPRIWASNMRRDLEEIARVPGLKNVARTLGKLVPGTVDNIASLEDEKHIEALRQVATKLKSHPNRSLKMIGQSAAGELERFNRMQSIGIKNLPELRAALREFHGLRESKAKDDPVKVAERKLIGRKIDGFFPTPRTIIDRMMDAAEIQPGMNILEPSAGKGDILDAVREFHGDSVKTSAIEPVGDLRELLALKGHEVGGHDFLEHTGQHDRILMNPPFDGGKDIQHVRHAFDQLAPGGRLVAIVTNGGGKKREEFDQWVEQNGGHIEALPERAFMGADAFRQTGVNTRMVVIDKSSSKYSLAEQVRDMATNAVERYQYEQFCQSFVPSRYEAPPEAMFYAKQLGFQFDEAKHPRDAGGLFAKKGEGGESAKASEPQKQVDPVGTRYEPDQAKELVGQIRDGDDRSKNRGDRSVRTETGPLVMSEIPTSFFDDKPDPDYGNATKWIQGTTSPDRVNAYRDSKEQFPPIYVQTNKRGQHSLSDGGHRLSAAIARGDKTIRALVSPELHEQLSKQGEANKPEPSAAHKAVASRFGIPPEAVQDIASTDVKELRRRDEYMPPNYAGDGPVTDYEDHPLGTTRIMSFGGPNEAYVDFMHEFDPKDLTPTEHEDGVKQRDKSYPKYVEWAKAGHRPPPISVAVSDKTGNYLSMNRRRVLAAQDAGVKKIKGWLGVNNKETGNPLKYGDVMRALKEHESGLKESTATPTPSPKPSKPPGVAGQQQGLFGQETSGQKSLFNVMKPAAKPKAKEIVERITGRLGELLAKKDTISQADKEIPIQSPSLPGQKSMFSRSAEQYERRWFTLGKDGQENRTRIQIDDDGRITAGPPSLKGDAISSLGDKSKAAERKVKGDHARAAGKTGRDYSTRQAVSLGLQNKVTQHQYASRAANVAKVATTEVLKMMPDAHRFLTEQAEHRERAKDRARKLTGMNAGTLAKIENAYRDYSTVPGFDEAANVIAMEHPELGLDPDDTDTPAAIWELIREGKQEAPAMHSEEVAELAARWLKSSKGGKKAKAEEDDDAVPFSMGRHGISENLL